ncbi:MAG TPA: hypothetical protein VIV12_13190 [Streptosporangiaceae bacterium]
MADITERHHGTFSYLDGVLADGTAPPCACADLPYIGSAHNWRFAIYRASHEDYDDSLVPTGTYEDALDVTCGLYLGDPTAWT